MRPVSLAADKASQTDGVRTMHLQAFDSLCLQNWESESGIYTKRVNYMQSESLY
jgi:hypothetical protein